MSRFHKRRDDEALFEIKNRIKDSGNSKTDVKNTSESEAVSVAFATAIAAAIASQRVKFDD